MQCGVGRHRFSLGVRSEREEKKEYPSTNYPTKVLEEIMFESLML